MKVLVTGAKGFVGRNLCLALGQMPGIEMLKYDLGDEAKLDGFLAECDFVMHLAGVNRPKDPEEFKTGNTVFTEDILDRLAARSNPPPVLLSSSIQAALDNDYGKSKKAAEDAVLAYGEKTGAAVYVYRLANVFGKWCRPAALKLCWTCRPSTWILWNPFVTTPVTGRSAPITMQRPPHPAASSILWMPFVQALQKSTPISMSTSIPIPAASSGAAPAATAIFAPVLRCL